MTPSENAAFRAGIRHAADMALTAALALEIRDDAKHLRQQAAIAALQGLAEALKEQATEFRDLLAEPSPARSFVQTSWFSVDDADAERSSSPPSASELGDAVRQAAATAIHIATDASRAGARDSGRKSL